MIWMILDVPIKYLGKNPFKYNIIYIYKWNKHQNQNATQKNK